MDPSNSHTRDTSHKHVTTACNACRRKRCKCNGRTPCALCTTTGDSCVYNRNDRRRQRRKQSTCETLANQPTTVLQDHIEETVNTAKNDRGSDREIQNSNVVGAEIGFEPQETEDEGYDRIDQEAIPETPSTKTEIPIYSYRTRKPPMLLLSRSDAHPDQIPRSRVCAMEDMQGKFKIGAGTSSHNSGADTVHSPHPKLLPKAAPVVQKHDDVREDDDDKHGRPNSQQQPRQFVWQLRRRRYAVPGYTRAFGNLPFSSAITANGYPTSIQALQARNFSTPQHLVFPVMETDESPLGRALIDFHQLGRRLIAEGMAPSRVADYGLIDVTLFFRDRRPSDPTNASTWTAEMLRSFRGTFPDELLLACAAQVTRLMRWFLVPTRENYASVPSMMRPTDLQRIKPHSPWIDLMMFPSFRDALTHRSRDWVEPCINARWSILWPHSLEEVLTRPDCPEQISLTPEFAAYVDNPKNWSMQSSILNEFPEVRASEINILQE